MTYYEITFSREDGRVRYGNLPFHFIKGYENKETDKAYFMLLDPAVLPEDSGAVEITSAEYEEAVNAVVSLENEKRRQEFRETVENLEARREEERAFKSRFLTASERFDALDKDSVSLENLKAHKITQLKEACSATIYAGFDSSTGHSFGYNELDQINFAHKLLLIVSAGGADTYEGTIHWKTKEDAVIELTAAEFMLVVNEAERHKIAEQTKYWQLEAEVKALEDKDSVLLVDWK